jgi:hypothetical protein
MVPSQHMRSLQEEYVLELLSKEFMSFIQLPLLHLPFRALSISQYLVFLLQKRALEHRHLRFVRISHSRQRRFVTSLLVFDEFGFL